MKRKRTNRIQSDTGPPRDRPVNIRLTSGQFRRVLAAAKTEGLTPSDIIRRGVELVVPERGPA